MLLCSFCTIFYVFDIQFYKSNIKIRCRFIPNQIKINTKHFSPKDVKTLVAMGVDISGAYKKALALRVGTHREGGLIEWGLNRTFMVNETWTALKIVKGN